MEEQGPPLWHAMHTVSFTYPEHPTEDEKRAFRAFYESIINVLRCPSCREHYSVMFYDTYQDGSMYELSKWVVDTHNKVNERLGKPIVSYTEAATRYKPAADGTVSVCAPDSFSSVCRAKVAKRYKERGIILIALAVVVVAAIAVIVALLTCLGDRCSNNDVSPSSPLWSTNSNPYTHPNSTYVLPAIEAFR